MDGKSSKRKHKDWFTKEDADRTFQLIVEKFRAPEAHSLRLITRKLCGSDSSYFSKAVRLRQGYVDLLNEENRTKHVSGLYGPLEPTTYYLSSGNEILRILKPKPHRKVRTRAL